MVAAVGAFPDRGGLSVLSGPELPAGPIGFTVMPGRLDQQPSGMAVAGLGDRSLAAPAATGLLAGHQAQPGPTVAPVKRCQSPISTASPNPVSTPTPSRQPSRPTTGAQVGVAASSPMATSRRSRRAWTASTAPWASSKPPAGQAGSTPPPPWPATARAPGPGSTLDDQPLAQQQLRQPMPGPHQVSAGVLPGPDQIPRRLLELAGYPHPGQLPDVQQTGPAVQRRAGRS
jgi:hypothetical protein